MLVSVTPHPMMTLMVPAIQSVMLRRKFVVVHLAFATILLVGMVQLVPVNNALALVRLL